MRQTLLGSVECWRGYGHWRKKDPQILVKGVLATSKAIGITRRAGGHMCTGEKIKLGKSLENIFTTEVIGITRRDERDMGTEEIVKLVKSL